MSRNSDAKTASVTGLSKVIDADQSKPRRRQVSLKPALFSRKWEKAQAVVGMFQGCANGVESMSTLAAWLNEQGFRTKSRKPQVIMREMVEGDGRRFTNYSVRDMLKNRFYLGEVRHKEERFAGRHRG